MTGFAIEGWVVERVLEHTRDLQRYLVRRADGVTGTMELAAANTAAAAALVARIRARTPAEIVAAGTDTFGNAYAVTGPVPPTRPLAPATLPLAPPTLPLAPPTLPLAPPTLPLAPPTLPLAPPARPLAPPAPFAGAPLPPTLPLASPFAPVPPTTPIAPPVPAQPAPMHEAPRIVALGKSPRVRRRNRAIWIGIAAIIALAIIVPRIVKAFEKTPPVPLNASASAAWADGCGGKLSLTFQSDRVAKIEAFGKEVPGYKLELDRAQGEKLVGTHEVTATAPDGVMRTFALAIPKPPRHEVITDARRLTSFSGGSISYRTSDGTHAPRVRSDYSSSGGDQARARYELVTCGVTGAVSADPATKIAKVDDVLHVEIDLVAHLRAAVGKELPKDVKVPFELALAGGGTATGTITVELSQHQVPDHDAPWANIAKAPIATAPLPADVATPRPMVVIWGSGVDRAYLGDKGSLANAPYVAIVSSKSTRVGACGPYGYDVYATLERVYTTVAVYVARTGKLVAQNAFAGDYPQCPDSIYYRYGEDKVISGDAPVEQVSAWLERLRR